MMSIPLSWLLGPWGWAPSWSSVTQKSFIDKLPIRDTFSLSATNGRTDDDAIDWFCHWWVAYRASVFSLYSLSLTETWELSISPEKILYTICYYYFFCKDITLLPSSLSVVGGRTIITTPKHTRQTTTESAFPATRIYWKSARKDINRGRNKDTFPRIKGGGVINIWLEVNWRMAKDKTHY